MLRISTIDTRSHRKLVLEGKLVEPWLGELRQVWASAKEGLQERKLVIDLTSVTVISHEGEATLFEFMQQGTQFSCGGVLIKHMLKQLARRCGCGHRGRPYPSHSHD
jgi:hypothetical protein